MAEGLLRKTMGNSIEAVSCGVTPVDPNDFMITVMREVGVDMDEHQPLSLADVQDQMFDRIIAFTPSAQAAAETAFEQREGQIDLWAVPDPSEGSLDVRAMLNNYRAIRMNIQGRITREFV